MNKSKLSVSQAKSKPKIALPSSTTNKSLSRLKEKSERVSPKANRMHTLEVKKSIEIPRKARQALLNTPLQEKSTNAEHGKGYETPKFKWEMETAPSPKKPTVPHNFFSFGEQERAKDLTRQVNSRQSQPERSPHPRGKGPLRKQNLLR